MANLATRDLVEAGGLGDQERTNLAHALIEEGQLDAAPRVRLIRQLSLPGPLDPDLLAEEGTIVLPELLEEGLVPDAVATFTGTQTKEFPFRERLFAASNNLSSFVTELELSEEEVANVFESRVISIDVKQAVVSDVGFVSTRLSKRGAIAICRWALKGHDLNVQLLAALSRANAPAEYIIQLVEPHLATIELPELDEILTALGDDYEPLTRLGRHRPRVKERDGTEELLNELQKRGRVSSFRTSKLGTGLRVNMKHE